MAIGDGAVCVDVRSSDRIRILRVKLVGACGIGLGDAIV